VDDRTLLSTRDPDPRSAYDKENRWLPELYQTHEIENGLGLVALPISIRLRHSIPPRQHQDWERVQAELAALLIQTASTGDTSYLALYADDIEKVTGVWNDDGPGYYENFIRWLSKSEWIQPVRLPDWTAANAPAGVRHIDVGTFAELAREFDAGEGYEKWFHSEAWVPYREHFEMTQRRVTEAKSKAADPALIELAEKQLLVSNWETAWHTPATGAHGDPANSGAPSPWARSLTSHCRHALVTAEAASWFAGGGRGAHAEIRDADADGEPDVVVKSESLFALISPRWGGRFVSLFHFADARGVMVIGNPCDDWNFLEDLNKFMDIPRNHPGAFADVGFENDEYRYHILQQGNRALIELTNVEKASPALGLKKTYVVDTSRPVLTVSYRLPPTLKQISVECALSPDYLSLLRYGSEIMKPVNGHGRGFAAPHVAVALEPGLDADWEQPAQEWIGHARTLRLRINRAEFQLKLRVWRL